MGFHVQLAIKVHELGHVERSDMKGSPESRFLFPKEGKQNDRICKSNPGSILVLAQWVCKCCGRWHNFSSKINWLFSLQVKASIDCHEKLSVKKKKCNKAAKCHLAKLSIGHSVLSCSMKSFNWIDNLQTNSKGANTTASLFSFKRLLVKPQKLVSGGVKAFRETSQIKMHKK